MNDLTIARARTIVTLARIAAGAGIMITSMITGVDGTYQMVAMFLLGIPFEAVQREKKED